MKEPSKIERMNQFMVILFCLSVWSCQGSQMTEGTNDELNPQAVSASVATTSIEKGASPVEVEPALEEKKEQPVALAAPAAKEPITSPKESSSPKPIAEEMPAKVEPIIAPSSPAPNKVTPEKTEQVVVVQPDHSAWDALLQQYVSARGKVNYTGFNANKAKLNAYLDDLAQHSPQSDWSRQEAMAYWINAYNAFTIKLILDNYPVQSIKDIAGGQPWDKKWIQLGGGTYSLNQIENDILRPQYQDARIHFAVNCAAKSCPPLHNRAFTAANLNSTLERLTRNFINNSSFNTIKENRVEVSKIFDWYGGDFGDLSAYLNRYTETKITAEAEINFKEYDWALNN